jgi:excinuclease UvrABC nuclease subunit
VKTETRSIAFNAAAAKAEPELWRQLPTEAAVFALYSEDAKAEPYVGRTPNLRGRLRRLLEPSDKHPRRLQLAGLVRRVEWVETGSDFEALLVQFNLLVDVYGARGRAPEALKRMHLRAPTYLRYLGSNPQPRLTVTTRPSQREAQWAFGPFASNAAAERFSDELLKLFLLRRCVEDLECSPTHPGCAYGEMKMCLAPCQLACTPERYAEESAAVERFIATRGESRLAELRAAREEASANLEFEQAAEVHAQIEKVEAVAALAPELVRPMNALRTLVLQTAHGREDAAAPGVNLFLFEDGALRGPVEFSTLGMRLQNEQSGSSSLFAQPVMMEPTVERSDTPIKEDAHATRDELASRFEAAMDALRVSERNATAETRQGHLALLKHWYYRPSTKREGEIFFPGEDGEWPVKAILRGIGRVAAKSINKAS